DYKHRAAREISVRYSADAIGDAGTGSQEGHSRPARAFGPTLGGVYRRLLVARIDNADAFAHASIVNTGDVPAAQGEYDLNSLTFEGFGDQPAAVYQAHVKLLTSRMFGVLDFFSEYDTSYW